MTWWTNLREGPMRASGNTNGVKDIMRGSVGSINDSDSNLHTWFDKDAGKLEARCYAWSGGHRTSGQVLAQSILHSSEGRNKENRITRSVAIARWNSTGEPGWKEPWEGKVIHTEKVSHTNRKAGKESPIIAFTTTQVPIPQVTVLKKTF